MAKVVKFMSSTLISLAKSSCPEFKSQTGHHVQICFSVYPRNVGRDSFGYCNVLYCIN